MKQVVLKFGLPEGRRVYASAFREAMARQPNLPNAFFHRDESGNSINGRPGIRTAGARGWVGVVADPGHEALLYGNIQQALAAANSLTASPCRVEVEERTFAFSSTNEPRVYWVRELAIKRRTDVRRAADLEDLVADVLEKSIADTCMRFGFDCPGAEALGVVVTEIRHQRGMLLQTTSGVTKESVTLVDAEVLIHADLDGHWFSGNLTSRGYGRIIRPLPGTFMDRSARGGSVLQ